MNFLMEIIEMANHVSPMLTVGLMGTICVMLVRFEKRVLKLEMELKEFFLSKKDFWSFMNSLSKGRKDE